MRVFVYHGPLFPVARVFFCQVTKKHSIYTLSVFNLGGIFFTVNSIVSPNQSIEQNI